MDYAVKLCNRPDRSQEQWIGECGLSESPLGWRYGTLWKAELQRVKCMFVAASMRPGVPAESRLE